MVLGDVYKIILRFLKTQGEVSTPGSLYTQVAILRVQAICMYEYRDTLTDSAAVS